MSDNERFTRCWTRAQPVVAGYINSLVPDFHEAEDLLQNVAVVLLRKFAQYDPSKPFVAWAIGVARNEIMVMKRRHARSPLCYRSEIMDAVADAYAELAPELEKRAGALRRCMERIRGRAWEMIRLMYGEALKPRQIAGRLGLSSGAVRTALSRARAELQKCTDRQLSATQRQT